MAELGNTLVNSAYEAEVNEVIAKRATSSSDKEERGDWIRKKYIARAFTRSDPSSLMAIRYGALMQVFALCFLGHKKHGKFLPSLAYCLIQGHHGL